MTDGIIQEIINEYINMEINVKKKGYSSTFGKNEDLLESLKQELITEIKKVCSNTDEVGCFCSRLIGA